MESNDKQSTHTEFPSDGGGDGGLAVGATGGDQAQHSMRMYWYAGQMSGSTKAHPTPNHSAQVADSVLPVPGTSIVTTLESSAIVPSAQMSHPVPSWHCNCEY
jgi:hypothetical protein